MRGPETRPVILVPFALALFALPLGAQRTPRPRLFQARDLIPLGYFAGRALELDPESPEVNYDLGYTYSQQNDYAMARRYAEIALRLRPDFYQALAVYGTALYMLHEDAAARKVLERAHRLRPEDASITRLLEKLQVSGAK